MTSTKGSKATNSVWDGVYTLGQAGKGAASYGSQCASCHGRSLEGSDDLCTPPLTGPKFWRRWGGESVGALYETIRATMPEHRAGSLSDDEYAAIVSFVLNANQMPAGQTDLPAELPTLKRIMITNRDSKR